MKRICFFIVLAFLPIFISCSQEEKVKASKDGAAVTPLISEREFLQAATDAIVTLMQSDLQYVSIIADAIEREDLAYLEDRVLFRDLFETSMPGKNGELFEASFRSACAAVAATAKGGTALDEDVLINFLKTNNISIYFPYPFELYEANKRIPAVVPNYDRSLETIVGSQLNTDGTVSKVAVNEEYAETNPVWIVNREEDYIFDATRGSAIQRQGIDGPGEEVSVGGGSIYHYEAMIVSIFVTNYFGNIFEGDLALKLCSVEKNPEFNTSTNQFEGYFDYIFPVFLPRKYVKYAKNGWNKGWKRIDYVFETDWSASEAQKFFAAYEEDKVKVKSVSLNTSVSGEYNGTTVSGDGKIDLEFRSENPLLGLAKWDRPWYFDVVENSTVTWLYDGKTTLDVAPDGHRLIKPGGDLILSVALRRYN